MVSAAPASPAGAGDSVDEILGAELALVMVDEQRRAGVAVHDALERRADPVVTLVGHLTLDGRRQDLAEGVQDDHRRRLLVPVHPGGDGVADPARLDPGQVLELGRDSSIG